MSYRFYTLFSVSQVACNKLAWERKLSRASGSLGTKTYKFVYFEITSDINTATPLIERK